MFNRHGTLLPDDLGDEAREAADPRLDDQVPAQALRVHVEHAAPRDRGGRGGLDVPRLEDEVGVRRQRDDLARHQAQLLVLVQHLSL